MQAVLKTIYSTDIDENLEDHLPDNQSNFGFNMRLIIGEKSQGGEESFDLFVCTPNWLIDNHKASDIIFGRHYLIVFGYDFKRIYNKINDIVLNTFGDDWNEIAMKLSRIGYWEFEDYQSE